MNADRHQAQRLLPVVNEYGDLQGVIARSELRKLRFGSNVENQKRVGEIAKTVRAEAYPDEPLRVVVHRMAEKGVTRMPVVERETRHLVGMISLKDLLKARTKHWEEERTREQIFRWRHFGIGSKNSNTPADAA